MAKWFLSSDEELVFESDGIKVFTELSTACFSSGASRWEREIELGHQKRILWQRLTGNVNRRGFRKLFHEAITSNSNLIP